MTSAPIRWPSPLALLGRGEGGKAVDCLVAFNCNTLRSVGLSWQNGPQKFFLGVKACELGVLTSKIIICTCFELKTQVRMIVLTR